MGLDGRWKRDNCRRINGKETYWHSSWYLYRCVYNRWSIADNATRDWRNQDVQRDCLSVARSLASEQDTQPLGISRWEVWDGREWLRPEHDSWHEVFTCPATQYEPPCASAGPRPPPPTATPAAPLPAPWPAFSMADCATSRGGFEVGGKAQWRPCTPRNVAVFGGKRLWACLEGLVLCNGDPDSNNPTRCEALRDFGCDRGVYDVAYHPDRGTVLLACRNGIISCNADANASAAAAVSDCVTVDTAPCPTGSIALGLAIPPRHPGLLVVGCWTEFAADEGVMLCPLGPAGALGDCVRKGVSPCGQPGRALLSGLSFDSSGGLIVGCQEDGYAYCTFGVSTGPSSCSRAVLGTSPCPLSTTGITQLAAGKIAAGCGAAGVRICRAGAALQPTREPTQTPTQPVAATWAPQSPGQPTALPAPGAPTHRPTVPVTWEPTTPLTTHAELPCHTIPGGALLLSGLATHRANGVYVRQDTKVIRARTTYWLRSGLLFLYSCSSKWFIASGSLYEEIPQMTSCPHVVEASTYPTLAAARWTAVTPQGDSDRQLEARAQCITSCDVSNGTGPATVYPCTCGTTWCSSAQWCSAATSNCSDCTEIRVAGFDTAVARAAPRKSKLAADSLGLDGLWRRDDCKRISGWETYWHNDGITYLYRCAYQRWAIADNLRRRWDKQDDHADCWSIARSLASEQDAQPLGISRWEVWDGQRFFSLEHDSWHTVLTCPNTSYVPPCFPGLPPPAAPPSAAGLQPVPDPLFGLTDCASTAGGSMLVNGSLRWHPCRPSVGVAAYEGKRLWVCPAMAVLCDGDFDSASPAVCTELGDLGCEEIFDAAFHPDGRRVFLACGGGVRSCEFDASANATSAVSHCENVTETTCPPGSTVGGVAVAPGDGRALVLGCHTGFSADEGVLICPMSPDWTQLAEGCKRKGVSPCGAAGFSTLGGLNFDTVGGLIGGCRRNGYAYCSFSIDSGPSSCSMSALGISPCPADGGTNAIAQFPSGRVAAACRWAGTKTCNGTALAVGLPSCDAASCTSAVTITTGLPSAVIGEPPYRQRRNDLVRGCEVRITSGLLGGDRLGLPLSYQSTYGVDAHWDGTALTIVPSLATVCSPWHCSCQGMSDYYGVRYSVSWGCSTWAAQSWWTGHKCRTNPGDGLADFPGCASTPAASTVMMPVEQCGTLLHRVTLTSSSSGTRTLRWGLLMPDGVVFHGGHYFRYFTQGKSWMQAAEACQNITMLGYKGYLATVTSRSEHQFLVGLNAAHVPPTQQWPHAWLGGADNETEGEWTWQTGCEKDEVFWRNGTSLTFTHWPEWEPNSFMGDEDGLVLDGRNTMWNDGHLDRVRAYICEFGGDCPSVGRPVVPLYGTVTVTVRTVSCHNGPAPGTAPPTPDVDFSSCSRLVSGQTCTPNYHCAIGYHSPRSSFILNCDQSATYNASAASPCVAKKCTAAIRIPDAGLADYSVCYGNRTGDSCTPACRKEGYSPTGTFLLACSEVVVGSGIEYVFDVAGVSCAPNLCSAGPLPDTISPYLTAASFDGCLGNRTGESCEPDCPAGFSLSAGQRLLLCRGDGSFDAASWSCLPPPPPPGPPGECIPGVCVHGAVQRDCTCGCHHHWTLANCTACPVPYLQHRNCSLPAVASLSVNLGGAAAAAFDLPSFLSAVRSLPADAQVAFVCLVPQGHIGVTEVLRRSSSCCRQSSTAQGLCRPPGAAARRAGALAVLDTVLDLEFFGATMGHGYAAGVVAAAASVGVEVTVATPSVCEAFIQCGADCVEPRQWCGGRGTAVPQSDGSCNCTCDPHFAGPNCAWCVGGGSSLCSASETALSVAVPGTHRFTIRGAWKQTTPPQCLCGGNGTNCEELRCVTRLRDSDRQHTHAQMTGDHHWPACVVDNSTVRCEIFTAGMGPTQALMYLDMPQGPEPRDLAGEPAAEGMLPLTFVGKAAMLSVRNALGTSLCGTVVLLTQEEAARWMVLLSVVDSQGTEVAEHFESSLCVPLSILVTLPQQSSGGSVTTELFTRGRECAPGGDVDRTTRAAFMGVLGGNGTLTARGMQVAGLYYVDVTSFPVPGSIHFTAVLGCHFTLEVLPGEPANIHLIAPVFDWPILRQPFDPPLSLRVTDTLGNHVTGAKEGAVSNTGADIRVYAWLTDESDTSVVTLTPSAGLSVPAQPQVAPPTAERAVDEQGVAVFRAVHGAAYGRAYLLHFTLDRTPGAHNAARLVVPLPLPRCPGANGSAASDSPPMAVFGRDDCVRCPPGLECDGSHRTLLLPGYWRPAWWTPNPSRCPYPSACVGSSLDPQVSAATVQPGFPNGTERLCAEGTGGYLCAVCAPGWRVVADRRSGDGQCRPCGPTRYYAIAAAELLAVFIFLLSLSWASLPYTLQRTGSTVQTAKLLIEALQVARLLKQVPVVLDAMVGFGRLVPPLLDIDSDIALQCTLPSVGYATSLIIYGVLPFLTIPVMVLAEQVVELVHYLQECRRSHPQGEVELELSQQVLAACSSCTGWACFRCASCKHTKCGRCLCNCKLSGHILVPVPLVGEGSRLRLPRQYALLVGAMIGAFLVLPTMMEKFTDRWRCVTFPTTAGEGCSELFPERCEDESRVRADITVACSDPATAVVSITCMLGWGVVAAAALGVALRHAASRRITSGPLQSPRADAQASAETPPVSPGSVLGRNDWVSGNDFLEQKLEFPLAGLHSTLAVGAWHNAYYAYRKPYWWWESFIILWKTSLFICFVLSTNRAFLLATLLCAASTLAHAVALPYNNDFVMAFSLVAHSLLTSAMLAAQWVTNSEELRAEESFSDLDAFTQAVLMVVASCSVGVLAALAVLFLRIMYQAVQLLRQLRRHGEVADDEMPDPEALHLAKILTRCAGAPPTPLTASDVEEWRLRYQADIPPLGTDAELRQLYRLHATLLAQTPHGPLQEIIGVARTPWSVSLTGVELARRTKCLLQEHAADFPGLEGVELLVLQLYTMEGPDVDGVLGYDSPQWRELQDLPYPAQVRDITQEAFEKALQMPDGYMGTAESWDALGEDSKHALAVTSAQAKVSSPEAKSQVAELYAKFRDGLLADIKTAQDAYKKYKAEVGDSRNQGMYKSVCSSLRTLQGAAAASSVEHFLPTLCRELRRDVHNVVMVLMHAARGLPELRGGSVPLWRGLENMTTASYRWHRVLRPGSFVGWAPPTSASLERDSAAEFATGVRAVLFCLKGVQVGIPLWALSRYPQEREVLLPPFTRWEVLGITHGSPLQITLRWRGRYPRRGVPSVALERIAADAMRVQQLVLCGTPSAVTAAAGVAVLACAAHPDEGAALGSEAADRADTVPLEPAEHPFRPPELAGACGEAELAAAGMLSPMGCSFGSSGRGFLSSGHSAHPAWGGPVKASAPPLPSSQAGSMLDTPETFCGAAAPALCGQSSSGDSVHPDEYHDRTINPLAPHRRVSSVSLSGVGLGHRSSFDDILGASVGSSGSHAPFLGAAAEGPYRRTSPGSSFGSRLVLVQAAAEAGEPQPSEPLDEEPLDEEPPAA